MAAAADGKCQLKRDGVLGKEALVTDMGEWPLNKSAPLVAPLLVASSL